mgnify:CR=1 FL=1
MKGNKKRFLALGLAVLMAGSPVAHLHAEEGDTVAIISQEAAAEPVAIISQEAADEPTQEKPASESESQENTVSDNTVSEKTEAGEIVEKLETEEQEETKQKEEASEDAEGNNQEASAEAVGTDAADTDAVTQSMVIGNKTYEDGDYTLDIESGFSMFKIESSKAVLKADKLTVTMTTKSASYDKIYLGNKDDEVKEPVYQGVKREGTDGYIFTFDLKAEDMGKEINVVPGKPDGSWYTKKQFTLTIPSVIVKDETETPEEPEIPDKEIENGDYNVTVDSNASMFKVVNCVLTKKDGQMSAVITLSGTGYDYLYMGTAEDAAKADKSSTIPFVENAAGKYTYTIPVSAFDTPIKVAAHSIKNDKWYDRELTFKSDGMEKIDKETPEPEPEEPVIPVNPDNEKPSTPENESGHVPDLNGGTVRVDSSTTLKDGVYTPDQFSWSGGTGKVSISCDKITIKNGQAYATIVFSSGHYSYVKANGNIYYGTNTGSTSTFVIPVQLNKNNTIIGMTTAMSAAHEIAYNLFIYLAAAGTGEQGEALNNQKLDQKAPVIMGLAYEEEIEMEYTKYVKLYRYENDIMLLEVDMKTDTEREVLEEETENLYEGNVVKYLIVPEDVEIPAGLDKNVIIIQRPLEKVFVADEDIRKLLKEEVEIDEELLMEGDVKEPDYKEIVKNKCNLAVFPSSVLEIEKDSKEKKDEKEQLLDLSERFATLQIPVFVDRMADEEKEEAKLEWLKVYGVLFDCEEKANEVYTEKLAELKATEKKN